MNNVNMCTLSPDKEEVKTFYWTNEDAQKLLRSLIRLGERHPRVAVGDIVDDLHEVETPLSIENIKTILDQFCEKALISRCEQDRPNDDMWVNVPLFDELTPFLNPEMGDVPDEDEFYQSSDAESSGSSEDYPIIVLDSDDDDLSDPIGYIHAMAGPDQSITMQPQKKRRIHRQSSRKSPRKSPKTNFYHSQFNGTALDDQSDKAISIDDEQARMISPQRASSDSKDFF